MEREAKVLCDGDKFRVEERGPKLPNMPQELAIWTYDGARPGIVWGYSPADLKGRGAIPSPDTIHRWLNAAATKYGVNTARQKYAVNRSFPLYPGAPEQMPKSPYLLTNAAALFGKGTGSYVGRTMVAGAQCEEYRQVYRQTLEARYAKQDGLPSNTVESETRVFVDVDTRLVLRHEQTYRYPGSPAPPMSMVFLVKSFKRLNAVDHAKFQLPPGSRAWMPKLFEGVKLPQGVVPITPPARYAATGMAFR
jgi:hypothetical protein